MRRRDLLNMFAAAPAVIAGRAWSAPQTRARLLLVFQRGGCDAAGVLIPTGSDFYYEARPTLHIAKPDPANADAALPLDAEWGLHPALKDSLYPLWAKRQIAFAPFAGIDDLSRSHFETQDAIELGQPIDQPRDFGSGFMSRLYGRLSGASPIAFTEQMPLTFRGGRAVPNIALTVVGKPSVDARQSELIQSMYAGESLGDAVKQGFDVRDQVYRDLAAEMTAAGRGAVSPRGFELIAPRIGRLMRGDYNLAFVDAGGWDTHTNQGAAKGYLADRLGELGRGLASFADALGPDAWDQTVVVVISEFGRTFRENGDHGTDHGHGAVYWVLGGQVRGGRIVGEQVKLSADTLNENRDYPVLTDYRALIGGLVQRLFGLNADQLATVFPKAAPKDLHLL